MPLPGLGAEESPEGEAQPLASHARTSDETIVPFRTLFVAVERRE
jgi:hypothetical protein